jgi:hypothetical protein
LFVTKDAAEESAGETHSSSTTAEHRKNKQTTATTSEHKESSQATEELNK